MDLTVKNIDTQHESMIHDAQYDFYGRRLATCSTDTTISIFDVTQDNEYRKVAKLSGHTASVWQVAWAHPKFGSILASCGYDKKIIIWKEVSPDNWQKAYENTDHGSSVNSIAWAPWEYGLALASGSSDTTISITTWKENSEWTSYKFDAHAVGVNSVFWAPASCPSTLTKEPDHDSVVSRPMRLVSGGGDKIVKIWAYSQTENRFVEEKRLETHQGWVRDVAWAPNIGLPYDLIATCSEDQTVFLWKKAEDEAEWTCTELPKFGSPVWRVSWSVAGNLLAVACGDNQVHVFKENLEGKWDLISKLNENAVMETVG
eukprot:CAMPEP_0114993370 /NCGR_PEP_ID=MMETSP0216-20121206/12489_1 /TAXON_ID=223996 /ORGANISM="Protocruzia adherens, Strain Boccale" /LENGTH=315 /DNA_ID=CAMNT_0002356999 /DNA_START=63 /DNA_END=1010 /DNA_ORIENTATION=+